MLPGTLDAIAERWVPGSGAVVVRPLASGLVNVSCRVDRDGNTFSLRIAAPDVDDLGLDREWECRVLRRASAAGVGPQIRECRPQQRIVVADWVSGRAWTTAQTGQAAAVEAMAELLRRVHALSVPGLARVMNAGMWITHYSAAAVRRGCDRSPAALALRSGADRRLRELAALGPVQAVLCHSDLHRSNVLDSGKTGLLLLDWEYAHISDGSWDLAGWAANNDWTDDAAVRLLAVYLQRPPAAAEIRRLQLLLWLYDYVCLLWSDVYVRQRSGVDSLAVGARAATVAARLSGGGSRAG